MNPGAGLITYQNTAPPGPNSTWVDGPIFQPLGPPPYPEPSTVSLLGLGTALVLLRRRRRRF